MSILSAIIDSREPPNIQSLTFGGVPTTIMALQAGDAWVATADALLCVERKTAGDLLNTIKEERLFSQAAKMREVSRFCYLVVTGPLERNHANKVMVQRSGRMVETGWNWDSIQGALLTVQELGVQVVYAADYESAVVRLAARDRGDVIITPARVPHIMSQKEIFLTSLEGIGPEKAAEVLAYTGGDVGMALWYLTDKSIYNKEKTPSLYRSDIQRVRHKLGLKENMAIGPTMIIEEREQ